MHRRQINMTTQSYEPSHPLVWIAGIATSLFCAAGFAAFTGWFQTAITTVDTPADVVSSTRTGAMCAECGVIESMREIDQEAGSAKG
jgi:hypothetical protein